MAISRFQSAFKVRTDMMDNITPNNTVQMNASVPAGEWKPASWLPVIWQNEASKDYFTISSGKVVSSATAKTDSPTPSDEKKEEDGK